MANTETRQQTFNALFEAESNAIFRFCLIRVSGHEQALDITQETFLRLWQTLQAGTVIVNARAFLFTVANRLIIDWYRRKKPRSLEADADEADPIDETTAGMGLELGAESRYLIAKLQELQPAHARAIYLRYIEGLSPPEIGEILGISGNAASVRINRGLKELRKLTGYEDLT